MKVKRINQSVLESKSHTSNFSQSVDQKKQVLMKKKNESTDVKLPSKNSPLQNSYGMA